jgi:hypothetical protein
MTNNLTSAPLAKTTSAENAERGIGSFFPFAGRGKNEGTNSFDSFLTAKDHHNDKADEDAAKIQDAKKRRKIAETQALVNNQSAQSPLTKLTADPDLTALQSPGNFAKPHFSEIHGQKSAPAPVKEKDSLSKVDINKEDQISHQQSDTTSKSNDQSDQPQSEDPGKTEQVSENVNSKDIPTEDQPPDGTKIAYPNQDMISLSSIDSSEYGSVSVTGNMPTSHDQIDTANPEIAIAANNTIASNLGGSNESSDEGEIEISGLSLGSSIAPVSESDGANQSSLNNFSQGPSVAIPTPIITTSSRLNRSADVSSVLKTLSVEMEKVKHSGQNRLELDLPVSEVETVKIRLHVRGEEIRTTFVTSSPELREALQKSWPEFASNQRDRNFRFSDPSFQNPTSQNNSFSQNQRQQTYEQSSDDANQYQGGPRSQATITRNKPTNTTPDGKVSLWA